MSTKSHDYAKNGQAPSKLSKHTGTLQRRCSDCPKKRRLLQRRPMSQAKTATVPPIVHEVLRSPGRPLDKKMRESMELGFSYDFSRVPANSVGPQASSVDIKIGPVNDRYEQDAEKTAGRIMGVSPIDVRRSTKVPPDFNFDQVRIHTDTRAAESARAMNAKAFTLGRNVVFASGQFSPCTADGQRLLAHELVHVLQQSHMAAGTSHLQRTIGDGHDLEAPCFKGNETLNRCFDKEYRMLKGEPDECAVRKVQRALVNLKFPMPKSTECFAGTCDMDGIYGSETEATVSKFKKMYLPPGEFTDGVVGQKTITALDDLCKGTDCCKPPSPTITSFSSCGAILKPAIPKCQPTPSTCWAAALSSFLQTRGITPKTTRPASEPIDLVNYYQWDDPGFPTEELRRLHPDATDFLGGGFTTCTPGRASRKTSPGMTMQCREDTRALPISPVDHLPRVLRETTGEPGYDRFFGKTVYNKGGQAWICRKLNEKGHILVFHSPNPQTWGHGFVVHDCTTAGGSVWLSAMDPNGGRYTTHEVNPDWTYWFVQR